MARFIVGDKLRIREWDDMVAEFGVDEDGDICTSGIAFTERMRHICGKAFTVSEVSEQWGTFYLSEERIEYDRYDGESHWHIVDYMLEFDENEAECEYNDEEIVGILERGE